MPGAQARPPRRQRTRGTTAELEQTQRPGKSSPEEKLEGRISLFPPRTPTFFSKGDSGSPVLSRSFLSSSSRPQPAPWQLGSQSRTWTERASAPRSSVPRASPRPRTHPAPCSGPSSGTGRPEVRTSSAASERARQPAGERTGEGAGGERVGISFPRVSGLWGPAREAKRKGS